MSGGQSVPLLCISVDGIFTTGSAFHDKKLRVDVQMSAEQIRELIGALLGGMPEPEAFALLREQFPSWFEE